jgi:heat-inducible transcriptional repressor
MDELTERQKLILALVVHEYARSTSPVGSQSLVEGYHLDMSSATVRNELSFLTDHGYLRQPHTSAGRIPTEEGYRYFVGRLLQETVLPESMRKTITHQFHQMSDDVEQWMRLAASVLSHQSRGASVVTAPHPERSHMKHIELISTRGTQVFMVMVLMGGEIQQRFMNLSEPASQEMLSSIATRLTNRFQGQDISMIEERLVEFSGIEREIVDQVVAEMRQANNLVAGAVYLDGISNVLAEPDFSSPEEAQRAIRVIQERSRLEELLTRTVLSGPGTSGVHVIIGGEGTYEDLRKCSLILARYGASDVATGTLGVLGPMRMSYGRTISTIRFLSGLLSDLVADTLVE